MLALLLLYGLQCMVRLPRGGLLFIRPLFKWRITAGPGWRLLHPIPSGACYLASRFILTEDEAGLCGRETPTRFGFAPLQQSLPRFDVNAAAEVEARGKTVRVGGTTFQRAQTKHAAEATAALLRDLQGLSLGDLRKRIARELRESLSLVNYRKESERLRNATSLLAWASNLYVLLLFAGLPILIQLEHAERALFMALPVMLSIHLMTLIVLVVTHRRLFPSRRGELIEQLVSCAIYPPGLLCALKNIQREILDRFHPATVAAMHLPKEALERFLRSELGRVELAISRDRGSSESVGLAALERDALIELINACGESHEALLTPPTGEDPLALTYCPVCLTDYRVAEGTCGDCGVALVRYGGERHS
ncbi:MAG: hypothetical protein IH885_01610 [Myxococcales bacterium]|nr:hypothetical protein [Myxococcales bacterium]